jgi:hypothetical protein
MANIGVVNVVSCDIEANTAILKGGGIFTDVFGTTTISGSNVLTNGPDDTYTVTGATLNVDNTSIIGVQHIGPF